MHGNGKTYLPQLPNGVVLKKTRGPFVFIIKAGVESNLYGTNYHETKIKPHPGWHDMRLFFTKDSQGIYHFANSSLWFDYKDYRIQSDGTIVKT